MQQHTPFYRYHAKQKDGFRFLFSTDANGGQGWTYDGLAFYTTTKQDTRSVALYQFHHDQDQTYGGWRFNYDTTMQPSQQQWTYDGICSYIFKDQIDGTIPIYQYHVAQTDGCRFHFSPNPMLGKGWTFDKVAFYAWKGDLKQ